MGKELTLNHQVGTAILVQSGILEQRVGDQLVVFQFLTFAFQRPSEMSIIKKQMIIKQFETNKMTKHTIGIYILKQKTN